MGEGGETIMLKKSRIVREDKDMRWFASINEATAFSLQQLRVAVHDHQKTFLVVMDSEGHPKDSMAHSNNHI